MKELLRSLAFRLSRMSKKYKQSKLYIVFIIITLIIGFVILITTSIKFVESSFLILSVKMAIVGQYISYIITNILVQIKQTEPIRMAFRKFFTKLDNIYDVVLTLIYSILWNHLSIEQKLFMAASNTLMMCIIIAKWVKIFFVAICDRIDKKYIALQNADYRSFTSNAGSNNQSNGKRMVIDMDGKDLKQQDKYRELNEEIEVQIQGRQNKSGGQSKSITNKNRKQNKNIIKLIQMASLPKNHLENKKYEDLIQDRNQNKIQDLLGNEEMMEKKKNKSVQQNPNDFSNFDAL